MDGFPDFSLDYSMDYSKIGFPKDPVSSFPPPGLEGTSGAVSDSPIMTSLGNFLGTVEDYTVNIVKGGYEGVKNVTKTVYDDVKSGVGTVVGDVTSPLGSLLDKTYWYLIGAVIIVGGVVYFAGKSGALRISR